jgi:serine/threonine protein kinase
LLKRGFFTGDGAPTEYVPPAPAELARYFPELEILELIGRGGMGAVYKARQKNLDRLIALKILPFSVNRDPAFAERFAREARALAKLTHPNIVSVHDSGQTDGLFYFIMEFVDGMNLRQLLNSGRIAPKEALAIVPQICDALQYAHDKGIVHRDIKPENILLDKTGMVKIADFGLAKLMGREAKDLSITDTHDVMGTPHYMAPEQVEHPLDVDHRADIYSLGVVFYQMLTGELPIGRFAPPSRKVQIDVRLDEVVLRALEKEPDHRYQHVSDVKTQVETILTSPPQNSAGISPVTPASPTGALSPWCRIISLAFGVPFTSPLAIKLVNISALGFLSFLAFLRFVPLPGMERCSGFSGFSGFFGLIGFAYIIEAAAWRRARTLASSTPPAAPTGSGGSPVRPQPSGAPLYHRAASLRDRWPWDATFLSCLTVALIPIPLILTACLVPVLGRRAWFFLFLELIPLLNAVIYFAILRRIDRLWLKVSPGARELAEGLLATRSLQTPCLAALANDRLELLGVTGQPITIPLSDIQSVTEIRWFNGKRLWWKRGLKIDRRGAPPVLIALAGSVILRWKPFLSGDVRALDALSLEATPKAQPHSSPASAIGRILGVLGFLFILIFILAEVFLLKTRNSTTTVPARPAAAPNLSFGPVIERVIQARQTGTNSYLDLDTGQLLAPPPDVTDALTAGQTTHDMERFWQALDIPENSRPFRYIAWLRESGADLMFNGDEQTIAFDGTFIIAHGDSSTNWDDWAKLSPETTRAALETIKSAIENTQSGTTTITLTPGLRSYTTARRLASRNSTGLPADLLTRDQSAIWFFKTRKGSVGVLQITGFTDNPPGVKIRYKLVQAGASRATAPFVAHYPGGTVELVALTSKPWTNMVCWRPDGTISKEPFPAMNGSMDQWAANMDVEKIAFRVHSENDKDISCPVARVSKDSGVLAPSSAWQAPYPQSPDGLFLQIITCPTNAETMNISLGVANDAWETGVTLNNSANALTGASAVDDWNAAYNAMVGSQGDVAVSFIYSRSDDWETRMAYVDGDGKVIPIQENGSRIKTSQVGGTLLIWSNEFARVKEFRLQKRKYQWVEFRNVSLRPGHLTQVENVDAVEVASARAFTPPATVLAEPILRYSGTVYYPSGKPAAGVPVAFYPGFYWGSGNYAETRTDTNGRYEIIQHPKTSNIMTGPVNPTNSIMAGDVRENLAAIQFFGAGVSNVDLTLQSAITLSGSVKNTDGKPVPGAEVDVRFLSGNSITPLRSQSTTVSELGLFSSPVLPQGREYWIYGIKAKGYGSAFARVEATDTKAITYSFPPFVLKPANYRLAGRVLDSKGKPLIGTRVSFSGPGQPQDSFTNTDSEGQFFFDAVCEGPIKIFANYQDPQDNSIYMNLNGGSGMEVEAGDTNILIKQKSVLVRPMK